MHLRDYRLAAFSMLATACLFAGCTKSGPAAPAAGSATTAAHDPEDVPITEADIKMPANYGEAVSRIKDYRDTIRSAIEGGTPTKAHRSLDELDIVLNKLPVLGRDSGVPKDQWEAVNTTARDLRNLFNELHSAIDEKREPNYAAVAKPIEQDIEKLSQRTPTPGK
jgi:hypothetical protein